MTSGFGVDPTKDGSGAITSGTSSQDIRQIFGGLYAPGVVSGGAVSTSSSAMTYTVTAGVGVVEVAAGQNIPIPIPATTLTAQSVPASGSRTDIVYAQQRFPSIEGDSEVIVNYGPTLPPRAIKLNTYIAPAGASNTSAGTVTGDVDYAIPYGTNQGVLYNYVHTFNGTIDPGNFRQGMGTIYLPTDRYLRFGVSTCLSALDASGFDNSKYCEFYYYPELDYTPLAYWNTGGLHQAWAIRNFELYVTVPAGQHVVSYSRGRAVGPGNAVAHYGAISGSVSYPGTTLTISDAGVAR